MRPGPVPEELETGWRTVAGDYDVSSTAKSGFNLDAALALKNLRLRRPMLQWRTELEQFCQFLIDRKVQSFLEIGVGSGQLSVVIKDVLNIGKVYACDVNWPPLLRERGDIPFFHGDHHSASYPAWREALGPVDMVFIDADHECGFRIDYTIELAFPHKYIAFHDVANLAYAVLHEFWNKEVDGNKVTLINTDANIRFGVPELTYPFLNLQSPDELERWFGRSCGIGICWDTLGSAQRDAKS